MILPNMLIFGAVKSGTGALSAYLQHHPEVFMAALKEPRYFMFNPDHTEQTERRNIPVKSLDDYAALFSSAGEVKIRGEASSNYLNSGAAALRIRQTLPQAKLIASLRNPVERACAHYSMINPGIALDERILDQRGEHWARTSCYAEKLKNYFDLFARDEIEVVVFEQWTRDIPRALAQLCDFLEIDFSLLEHSGEEYVPAVTLAKKHRRNPWFRVLKSVVPPKLTNALKKRASTRASEKKQIPDDVREAMFDWYKSDVARLEDMLQMDLSVWRDNPVS